MRYRKPYTARHTSVSWNLMRGKNPLWVAEQHGHRIATMFSVYAAWVQGARECDIAAIRRAMGYDQHLPTNRTSPSVALVSTPATSISRVVTANFLTGAGTKFERLTIRLRVDAPALQIADSKGETPPRREPAPPPEPERKRHTGKKFASEQKPKAPKWLTGMKKTGGADGTRIAAREFSKLLIERRLLSPSRPHDPHISQLICQLAVCELST
ncbi:MAG TPA: hypothetical protein VHC20_06260 [Candidatus Paceibacterota bacterium]|nr:hypothetical protein [Candidatus Paceibacterota bacterium]